MRTLDKINKKHALSLSAASRGLLARGVERSSPVTLEVELGGGLIAIKGLLHSLDGETIIVRWPRPGRVSAASLKNKAARCTLIVDDAAYEFEAEIRESRHSKTVRSLCLVAVGELVERERRRARRRTLHERTPVTLYVDAGAAEAVCEASLLNISAEGLACRVSKQDVALLERADGVCAEFWLGRVGALRLNVRVVTATPSGQSAVILGLECLNDPETLQDRRRLQEALAGFDNG